MNRFYRVKSGGWSGIDSHFLLDFVPWMRLFEIVTIGKFSVCVPSSLSVASAEGVAFNKLHLFLNLSIDFTSNYKSRE